ncbi:hypothetical protein XBKB1_2990003 [Xenorhabdus bovienii str. kraussei Becker Underwood]|uniref:Uncharacterized protein n=1 Tax=Xenorhabdus bovienii str. kraussei Becker Underwood TaxID=1398204 RepID=A0A077PV23_XENBV|nr:hypothetical protein XBKB1_2990003 [Xenorhabdus bovienii str. kraussei Becker Underwood]
MFTQLTKSILLPWIAIVLIVRLLTIELIVGWFSLLVQCLEIVVLCEVCVLSM